ncbi:MAG TPA: MauE/DoxX family redox-associated membrane protein [Chloroflexaceae bacterium]|nr:MauE/DoxX family redox-associated membrane protein [Chloroflexaceae bacterium]
MGTTPFLIGAASWLAATGLIAAFALAALAKLRDAEGARAGLRAFGVPEALAAPAFGALALGELLIAGALALPPTRRAGALLALVALAAFTLAIGWQLARGRRPACACFGALSRDAIGWRSVGRNLLLMALAALLLAPPSAGTPAISRWPIPPPALLALACGGAVTLWLVLLTRQNGRLLARIERLEGRPHQPAPEPAPAGPLAVGDRVPPLGLSDARGRPFDLGALRGRPALLLFLDNACAHCRPLLARLRESHAPEAALVVITESEALRHELPPSVAVLLDPGWSTLPLFRLRGTPAAVALDADGALAQLAVHGTKPVQALLDQAITQEVRREVAPV